MPLKLFNVSVQASLDVVVLAESMQEAEEVVYHDDNFELSDITNYYSSPIIKWDDLSLYWREQMPYADDDSTDDRTCKEVFEDFLEEQERLKAIEERDKLQEKFPFYENNENNEDNL